MLYATTSELILSIAATTETSNINAVLWIIWRKSQVGVPFICQFNKALLCYTPKNGERYVRRFRIVIAMKIKR